MTTAGLGEFILPGEGLSACSVGSSGSSFGPVLAPLSWSHDKTSKMRLFQRLRDWFGRSLNRRRQLSAPTRRAVLVEAIPFQDDIEEIMEERPPAFMRGTHYLLVALFLALLVIATVVRVDVVVVGNGRLASETPPIMLQPMERSIIRELKVKPGDLVEKGQVVASLDATFAEADVAGLVIQQKAAAAQMRRLEAELADGVFDPGPSPSSEEALQASLSQQHRAEYNSHLSVFDEDIMRFQSNLQSTNDDYESLSHELAISRDLEKMRHDLLESPGGSRLQYLEAQATRVRVEREYYGAGRRIGELTHNIRSKQAERAGFIEGWRRQLSESLVATRADAAKAAEALAKASRLHDLVVVTAPEDGVVLDVAKRSVGSVLREAEPLMTIMPADATLIAEIQIESADIGYVKPGDPVVIKIDAFPYQRHGLLPGRLLSVSEDSFSPGSSSEVEGGAPTRPTASAFHRGRVELLATRLDLMPKGARLIPGMTMAADIKVNTRSIISYILYPLSRALTESVREP